jgi:hypothetical protein
MRRNQKRGNKHQYAGPWLQGSAYRSFPGLFGALLWRKEQFYNVPPVGYIHAGLDHVSTGEENTPHLMEPGRMLKLVRQKTFNMGDVEKSADELRKARGFKASEKELREIKKELKALHGEIKAGEPSLQDRKHLE